MMNGGGVVAAARGDLAGPTGGEAEEEAGAKMWREMLELEKGHRRSIAVDMTKRRPLSRPWASTMLVTGGQP